MNGEDQRIREEHRKGIKQSSIDARVTDALLLGLQTEGSHHKQWALWQVGQLLGLTHFLDEIKDRGIKP